MKGQDTVESEQDKQGNGEAPATTTEGSQGTAKQGQAAAGETQSAPAAGETQSAPTQAEAQTAPAEGEAAEAAPANASGKKVFIGLGVGAVVIIGAALAMQKTPQSANTVGSTVAADITLVTSDRADVDCAAASGIETYRCAFTDENLPWKGDEKNTLKPFYTTDRHLYLVPGLFTQPAVLARYNSEPPTKPRSQLKRFTAKCDLKIVGKVSGVRVRWLSSAAWSNPEEVEVGTPVSCKVE